MSEAFKVSKRGCARGRAAAGQLQAELSAAEQLAGDAVALRGRLGAFRDHAPAPPGNIPELIALQERLRRQGRSVLRPLRRRARFLALRRLGRLLLRFLLGLLAVGLVLAVVVWGVRNRDWIMLGIEALIAPAPPPAGAAP